MRDVNAEFAQSKVSQINAADDKRAKLNEMIKSYAVTDLGNGLYRINNGWDRGEVLRMDLAKTGDQIKGQHGLDLLADGATALYLDSPAWHETGTVIRGGSSSLQTVLTTAGLDWKTLLRKVRFLPNQADDASDDTSASPMSGILPDRYVTMRSDTHAPLGVVGSRYTPIHNANAFGFMEDLFGDNLMVASSAGSFMGGSRVFISAEMPEGMFVDPGGVNDYLRMFLVVSTSHDGSTPSAAVATPFRPVCGNTERLALANARTKWVIRHTSRWADRLEEAKRSLSLTTTYMDAWVEEQTDLLHTPFHANQIDALCDQVWGAAKDLPENAEKGAKRAATMNAARRDAVRAIFAEEVERVGANAYAAERAITGYVDEFADLRPTRAGLKGNRLAALGEAILTESLEKPKATAHKALMMLTTR